VCDNCTKRSICSKIHRDTISNAHKDDKMFFIHCKNCGEYFYICRHDYTEVQITDKLESSFLFTEVTYKVGLSNRRLRTVENVHAIPDKKVAFENMILNTNHILVEI